MRLQRQPALLDRGPAVDGAGGRQHDQGPGLVRQRVRLLVPGARPDPVHRQDAVADGEAVHRAGRARRSARLPARRPQRAAGARRRLRRHAADRRAAHHPHALEQGAAVVLASHLGPAQGRPRSQVLAGAGGRAAGRPCSSGRCRWPPTASARRWSAARALKPGQVLLLENLRFHPEEESQRRRVRPALAALADVYVNDAFAAAHRAHASIAAITRHLQPAAAGLLMRASWRRWAGSSSRRRGRWSPLLGGAKVSDKLALVEHLLARVDALLIGGGMAFTFLRALGHGVGKSLVEADRIETARRPWRRRGGAGADRAAGRRGRRRRARQPLGARGVRPRHPGRADGSGHRPPDRGAFRRRRCKAAKTIVWNGPWASSRSRRSRRHRGAWPGPWRGPALLRHRRRRHGGRGEPGRRRRPDRLHLDRRRAPSWSSSRAARCPAWRRSRRPDAHAAGRRQLEDERHAGRGARAGRPLPRRPQAAGPGRGRGVPALHRAAAAAEILAGSPITLGAQNCHHEATGATPARSPRRCWSSSAAAS